MKKTKLLLLIVILFFVSSCQFKQEVINEVYYSYNSVVVKRIDNPTTTTLYYMKDGQPIDSVWIECTGRDRWFRMRLVFDDEKVILAGYMEQNKRHKNLFKLMDGDMSSFEFVDSLVNLGQAYSIQLYTPKMEIEFNLEEEVPSKVKAEYCMLDEEEVIEEKADNIFEHIWNYYF